MRKIKFQASFALLSSLLLLLTQPAQVLGVNLNNQSGDTQTFQNDSNVTVNSNNNVHSLGWQGLLPLSRGGTGIGNLTAGSVLFSDGQKITQDNSNFFWDNTNKTLGIGTKPSFNKLAIGDTDMDHGYTPNKEFL